GSAPEHTVGTTGNPIVADQPHDGDAPAPALCGAKNRSGGTCKLHPVPGRRRCKFHGGMSPVGIASPHYKHRRYSRAMKHLAKDLALSYKRAVHDRELTSLRSELALLSVRGETLLEQLGAVEAPPWGKVLDALVSFERAKRGKDKDKQEQRFQELAT